jgi:hypothetical protein
MHVREKRMSCPNVAYEMHSDKKNAFMDTAYLLLDSHIEWRRSEAREYLNLKTRQSCLSSVEVEAFTLVIKARQWL